mgnify:CR=1 FL=1
MQNFILKVIISRWGTSQLQLQNWLQVFKFPSVERTTYDRLECTAKNQIYTILGDKIVVFKHKRRKAERRTQGHRQQYTVLTVTGIVA